jgi:hypothetical protein
MDSTLIIAVTGLAATTATALGVPVIQGRVATRNATRTRLDAIRLTAYTAASAYAEAVNLRLRQLTTPIEARRSRPAVEVPAVGPIGAQLRLVAPRPMLEAWHELVGAWEWLESKVATGGPSTVSGEYWCDRNSEDVLNVKGTLRVFTHICGTRSRNSPPCG